MMNERIKELSLQAEQWCYDNLAMPTPAEWNDKFHQKFAELIVGECCQKLENDGMVEVAMELKEHFGVE
jgi:hypothetical protein